MLEMIFQSVLKMSASASLVIALVVIIRMGLHRAPKIFSYILWSAVLIRLICPIQLESHIGILPYMDLEMQSVGSEDIGVATNPGMINEDDMDKNQAAEQVKSESIAESLIGESSVGSVVDGAAEANAIEGSVVGSVIGGIIGKSSFAFLWLLGMLILLGYSFRQYLLLKKKLQITSPVEGENRVYLADGITSAFVLGVIKPCIYLPSNLEGEEREYILAHEKHHVRRLDYGVRFAAFLALVIHWFNPLVWVAFTLAGRDMEMSCDEAVLGEMNGKMRSNYASSLLNIATNHRRIYLSPLAFGLCDTKQRVQNVLTYKKPKKWMLIMLIPVIIMLIFVITTNEKSKMALDENGKAIVNIVDYQEDGIIMAKENMEDYKRNYEGLYDMDATAFIESIIVPAGMEVQPYKISGRVDVDDTQLYYGGSFLILCENEEPVSFVPGSECNGFIDDRNGEWTYQDASLVNYVERVGKAVIGTRGYMEQESRGKYYSTEMFDVVTQIKLPGTVEITHAFLKTNYYQLEDCTWSTGTHNYKYKFELIGRMNGAAKDTTFIVLSNLPNISFDQAWKAAGFSSNLADYFDPEDAVIVENW